MKKSYITRFFSKVKKTNNCWVWTGARNQNRGLKTYGLFRYGNRMVGAHRISYLIHMGSLPDLGVLHKCDNPVCVNPEHLWAGTQKENSLDMISKNRSCGGEKHYLSKLTRDKALKIRNLYRTKNITQSEIGRIFGVSRQTVGSLVNFITWKNV